jgi:hypothetical protein
MKYLKRKYLKHSGRFAQEWQDAIEAYRERYPSIEHQLPESARRFEQHTKRCPLHDAAVLSITRPTRDTVQIQLDDWRLEFLGVAECEFPERLEPQIGWLYEELDLANSGLLELRALIDEGDFRVAAREVRVFDERLKRFVVPEEPPPPQPTLFLDKESRARRRKR